jgi:hypothetical protein
MSIPGSTISLLTKTAFTLVLISASMACFGESISLVREGMLPVIPDLQNKAVHMYKFVTLAEAEKVMGEKAHVKDSVWRNSGSITKFMTTMVANETDKKTGKAKKLFFSFENYPHETDAKELYALIKAENEKTAASSAIDEIGDGAFVVKDQLGFPFIMVRKGSKIFKFKTYYVTDKDGFERLKTLVKKVVADN